MKLTKVFIKSLTSDPIPILKKLEENDIANILQQANHSYYNSDKPLFSDNTFDLIREYLESVNPKHPILKNIGSNIDEDKKVELPYFMGSLDKIKTDEKILDKFKKEYKDTYVISDKLDGNSGMIYIKGKTVTLYSRGDGTFGQNLTHLLPFIKNIPENLSAKELAIRGEIICSKKDFDDKFKDKMANARNMVAGLINSKIPDLNIANSTQFVAYEIVYPKMTPEDQMKEISKLGFKCVYNEVLTESNLNTSKLSEILVKRRDISEFEVDGIVVMHNAIHKRMSSNPKYGFAFKSVHTMQKAEVIVTHVEWNMSKDGYLIPVVNFNGINLAGVMIRRAHGFNGKFIKDNKIGPGSKIIIMRSGDVIPYIDSIISVSETGEGQMPDLEYDWTKTGVDILIKESAKGDDITLKYKNLEYFFDKLEITGLSSGNLKKIFDGGFITVKSILEMKKADFLKIDGFKGKMADKLFDGIQAKKNNVDCVLLMNASNTLGRGMGSRKIKLITDIYPNIISNNYIPSITELIQIKGIEQKTAQLFITNLPKFIEFKKMNGLECLYDNKKEQEPEPAGPAGSTVIVPAPVAKLFIDKIFVFTGFRSKILEDFITSNGGKVNTSISSKTSFVIRKDDEESTKVDKANELGIKLINLSDFEKEYKVKAK
jgi:NAD-dependent DNA ligase